MNNEQRRFQLSMRWLVLIVVLGVVFLAGRWSGLTEAQQSDVTVLPCSAYADTSTPTIPPFTFTGACSLPDGSLSTPNN